MIRLNFIKIWSNIKSFFLRKFKKPGYLENSFIIGYNNIKNDK